MSCGSRRPLIWTGSRSSRCLRRASVQIRRAGSKLSARRTTDLDRSRQNSSLAGGVWVAIGLSATQHAPTGTRSDRGLAAHRGQRERQIRRGASARRGSGRNGQAPKGPSRAEGVCPNAPSGSPKGRGEPVRRVLHPARSIEMTSFLRSPPNRPPSRSNSRVVACRQFVAPSPRQEAREDMAARR